MIHTPLKWTNVRQHFGYTWWAYALMAVILLFGWQMAYRATEYVPPPEKTIHVTIAGDYVSESVLEYYEEKAYEEFPEMELITFENIPLSLTGEGDYSGYTKLSVVIAVGEGDVYLLNRELLVSYSSMQAFMPLDDAVAEGGALYGVFSEEEIEAAYDGYVASDEATYADPYQFENAFSSDTTIYYTPEGYRNVKHILFKFDDDQATRYDELSTRLADLEAEQVAAAEAADATPAPEAEDGEAESPRAITEIEADIAQVSADLDALYEELMPEAEAAIERFNAGEDIDALKANTAIAQLMIYVNALSDQGGATKAEYELLLQLLNPFAPHMTEELWQQLGHTEQLAYHAWPTYDEAKCTEQTIEIAVQVNGKVKARIHVPAAIESADAIAQAKAEPAVAEAIAGKTIAKEIYVKGKLVNIAVKG